MPNIAMWGATGTGKTTFLAALSLALTQQGGDWNVTAADEPSEKVLIEMTSALSGMRAFPQANLGVDDYQWELNGTLAETVRTGRFRREKRIRPVSIGLNLADASGEAWNPAQHGTALQNDMLKRLKDSRGIVYMFDPIREFERGDAHAYTFAMCVRLSRLLKEDPDFNGRLPHHVAVCVTKFDELRVYETARRLGLLATEPEDQYEFPRVHEDLARDLLSKLCDVSGSGNGAMVEQVLTQYFRPERIKYFITSSIGFYVNPRTGRFEADDPQNLLPDEKAQRRFRIRGPVRPINVVEPVMWLSERLTGLRTTGAGR